MYDNPKCKKRNNDPLSVCLFVIAIEILADKITMKNKT